MTFQLIDTAAQNAVPLSLVSKDGLADWKKTLSDGARRWLDGNGFTAADGEVCIIPAEDGSVSRVAVGLGDEDQPGLWSCAGLVTSLPPADYVLEGAWDETVASAVALGWALGSYRFTRYKSNDKPLASLIWPEGADRARVEALAEGCCLTRDLINTPSNDMGPAELAEAAQTLAAAHGASCEVTVGEALLRENYPAIYVVGQASSRAPRLIDLRWGEEGPAVTLVGKGVCFDTGGLDLKPASNMLLMKKDMGGAAHVLGLAAAIMKSGVKCRLRVLIPAVENAVAGNAFRPSDIIQTRKGISVEVGNTDAEGRLVLCDALAEADREEPDLILDFATLTGAARAALGTELPALFSNSDDLAQTLRLHSVEQDDEVWHMPLHRPYRRLLDSKIADINNISSGPFGGAITAALYLAEFVSDNTPWAHFDIMAYNTSARPGRPEGGEAMGLRAVFAMIEEMTAE